jgi:propionate CoA-transferase
VLQHLTLTAEPGIIGGMPQGGLNFGTALNPDAVIHQNQQFDFYDGGGLDLACLGMAQADAAGNVNVSRFSNRLAGAGGFINISQSAKKIVFAGTFTSGGLKIAIEEEKVHILREGSSRKFIKEVEQVTFSGDRAAETGQVVLYVTERCVLERTPAGLELIEIAPGVNLDRDVLGQMDFEPLMRNVRPMDPRIFRNAPMGLDHALLGRNLADRITYDSERNILFVNFEGFEVRTVEDVDRIRGEVERRCREIGKPVALIASYDGFYLDRVVSDTYFSMIAYLEKRYYSSASRYTTSAFMRLKLGEALTERHVAPHIFETQAEAQQFARSQRVT